MRLKWIEIEINKQYTHSIYLPSNRYRPHSINDQRSSPNLPVMFRELTYLITSDTLIFVALELTKYLAIELVRRCVPFDIAANLITQLNFIEHQFRIGFSLVSPDTHLH